LFWGACADGDRPITIIFDGTHADIIELNTPQELFFSLNAMFATDYLCKKRKLEKL